MSPARIVTRFAPSPTGNLHIGGARTALFNWLFARANNGKFLLRIEDTDRERSTEEAARQILASLKWLHLDWDGSPVSQFSRQAVHRTRALELLTSGQAYKCFATAEEIATDRADSKTRGGSSFFHSPWRDVSEDQHPDAPFTVRLKTPETGQSCLRDMVFGEIRVNNDTIDDLIILRSDGTPTYNFAVVVDDHDMEVSHIIRGDDHMANTFKQKLIFEAFGWPLPIFAHVPLIHNEQGKKLSKRDGAIGTEYFEENGYLPDAIFNFLARLGWSHGNEEIFDISQLVEKFKLEDLRKSPSRLDFKMLKQISGHYISILEPEGLYQELVEFVTKQMTATIPSNKENLVKKALPLVQARSKTLKELWMGLEFVLNSTVDYDEKSLKILSSTPRVQFNDYVQGLTNLAWDRQELEEYSVTFGTKRNLGLGKVLQPVRAALVGKTVSPSVFDIFILLGRQESQERLAAAADITHENNADG